jgi:hypothetical protein
MHVHTTYQQPAASRLKANPVNYINYIQHTSGAVLFLLPTVDIWQAQAGSDVGWALALE